jgi:hypothetical protein
MAVQVFGLFAVVTEYAARLRNPPHFHTPTYPLRDLCHAVVPFAVIGRHHFICMTQSDLCFAIPHPFVYVPRLSYSRIVVRQRHIKPAPTRGQTSLPTVDVLWSTHLPVLRPPYVPIFKAISTTDLQCFFAFYYASHFVNVRKNARTLIA